MTYGNPSGHASFAACMYPTIFMLLFHDKDYMADAGVFESDRKSSDAGSIVGGTTVQDYKWYAI